MRYGATEEEWALFSLTFGIVEDLLPVVSNPNAEISAKSDIRTLGKIPTIYNGSGKVAGIKDWPQHKTTDAEIERWSRQEDYGICLQTRNVRAIDIDVESHSQSDDIRIFIKSTLRNIILPERRRADSAKCLFAFKVLEQISKRVLKVDGGIVEILGDGQHFVACGTHPKGQRYEWDWQGLSDFPELTGKQFEILWAALVKKFGVELPSNSSQRKNEETKLLTDETAGRLIALGRGKEGEVYFTCPWKDQHTVESGITETVYFPRGSRGYELGHFRCLHAHCTGRTDREFEEALGIRQDVFEPIPKEEDRRSFPVFKRINGDLIKPILENIKKAVERPDVCGYEIAKDLFQEAVLLKNRESDKTLIPITDNHYTLIQEHLETKIRFKPTIPKDLLIRTVEMVAIKHGFDSAQIWLKGLVWDGKKRIDNYLPNYAKTETSAYARAVSKYMWTALAGRLMQPGIKADMVPIFIGAQGTFKTTSVQAIVPYEEWAGTINLEDKDADLARVMKGKVVLEISEFRGLHNNKEVEPIKTFISSPYDEWVPKFKECSVRYLRRSLFIGTSNNREILADKTGHRRWLPIDTGIIDTDSIRRDRDQLWAEARDTFLKEGIAYAAAEELAKDRYDKYTIQDSWEIFIEKWLNTKDGMTGKTPLEQPYFHMSDVFKGALHIQEHNCRGHEAQKVGKLLLGMGIDKDRKRIDGRLVWVWLKKK